VPRARADDRVIRFDLRSLRRRLAILFAMLSAVLGVATILGVSSFNRLLDERRGLVDRVDPALTASDRLVTALIDQETGVRGYALAGGEESFLEPYTRGAATERTEAARLRRLTAQVPEVREPVADTIARAEAWRAEIALPTIAAIRSGGSERGATARIEAGKQRFDAFRTASATLSRQLTERRARARAALDDATTRLEAVILGGLVAVILAGIVLWLALRRWIVGPLSRLGQAADAVSGGELEHPIVPDGPREIERLGLQMEAMRARIVRELTEVTEARTLLDGQARDLQRSNAELEQFAYVASHDLQEPLRKVAGFCELLQRRYGGELDDRADQYIQFAVDGATRMQRLINDLLDFSRVGRTTERFEPVDLGEALAAALAYLEGRREEAGAEVTSDPLPVIQGDLSLLTALFQNLIGNAIKFHGDDPPRVHVACTRGGDDEWMLEIRDNGIGIEPEYADRVFIIFQRLHSKDAYEGTGIGLAMCKKIVEFHGGRIDVAPNDGPGTTVRIALPTYDRTELHG